MASYDEKFGSHQGKKKPLTKKQRIAEYNKGAFKRPSQKVLNNPAAYLKGLEDGTYGDADRQDPKTGKLID